MEPPLPPILLPLLSVIAPVEPADASPLLSDNKPDTPLDPPLLVVNEIEPLEC
jgi:hypothetical protein